MRPHGATPPAGLKKTFTVILTSFNMVNIPAQMPERFGVTRSEFETEIMPAGQPVIMRGLVADWPILAASTESTDALAAYLKKFESGSKLNTMITRPHEKGRYFYNADMTGFNFEKREIGLSTIIDKLLEIAGDKEPMGIYAGSAEARDATPGFDIENPMPLLNSELLPRIWLGNKSRVAAHYDISRNIACCVAGRRRFTVFPPEQAANLYHGPFEFTMAGPPASLVDFHAPNYARYPRFRDAEKAGLVAQLEPGDAIYIPSLWWHHVEAFDPFSLLVNYWWTEPHAEFGFESLLLAIHDLRDQPETERMAWKAFFDHYVFGGNQENMADHIPAQWQTVLGKPSAERTQMMMRYIMSRLDARLD
jgi:hypothetical protein